MSNSRLAFSIPHQIPMEHLKATLIHSYKNEGPNILSGPLSFYLANGFIRTAISIQVEWHADHPILQQDWQPLRQEWRIRNRTSPALKDR
jgi:hypothetical protein